MKLQDYLDAGYKIFKDKIYSPAEWEAIERIRKEEEQYDLLQLTKKIKLNSCYGALLNEWFKFGRRELGASVTGTGRQITTHMLQTINHEVSGEYKKLIKTTTYDKDGKAVNEYHLDSPVIIGGDTDSAYFKTFKETLEETIEYADEVAAKLNSTFPKFMQESFNSKDGREKRIEGSRELVGDRALFLKAKKKYTIRVRDKEGKAVNELKIMGSEIKKADTPKAVQDFLRELVLLILDDNPYKVLEKFVNSNRKGLIHKSNDLLGLGAVKQVNNLDAKYAEYERTEKVGNGKMAHCPGHVRAAINYNELVKEFEENPKLIASGDKITILYLKPNDRGLKSIAFSSEAESFPDWFLENFVINLDITEQKMIDLKITGVFEALGYEVPTHQTEFMNTAFTF